jgi:hypothetical protein
MESERRPAPQLEFLRITNQYARPAGWRLQRIVPSSPASMLVLESPRNSEIITVLLIIEVQQIGLAF